MRRIFLAAALFGVMSGLAGAMAYGWLREGADAAPPLVAREDELSIIAGGFVEVSNPVDGAWHDVRDVSYAFLMPADPGKYRDGVFRLELAGEHQLTDPSGTVCVRLAGVSGESRIGVAGSELCSSQKGVFFLESAQFSLPVGERVYVLQSNHFDNRILRVNLARIVAEWQERR